MLNYQELPRTDYAADYAYIESHTEKAQRYIQLAEEYSEAAQVCIKIARALNGEVHLQEDMPKLLMSLTEESTDIEIVKASLRFRDFDEKIFSNKLRRWVSRVEEDTEAQRKKEEARIAADIDPLIRRFNRTIAGEFTEAEWDALASSFFEHLNDDLVANGAPDVAEAKEASHE